jgi:hypothetical protein
VPSPIAYTALGQLSTHSVLSQAGLLPLAGLGNRASSETIAAGGVLPDGVRLRRAVYSATIGRSGEEAEEAEGEEGEEGEAVSLSGTVFEPLGGWSSRGVLLYLHNSQSALTESTALASAVMSENTRVRDDGAGTQRLRTADGQGEQHEALLCSLLALMGFVVVSPDELGLGRSAGRAQASYVSGMLADVAIELLRGVLQARSLAGQLVGPQLWVAGGGHGGFEAAAIHRRLQQEESGSTDAHSTLLRSAFGGTVTGSLLLAAPLDLSGAMRDAWAAQAAYPQAWHLALLARAFDRYAPGRYASDGYAPARGLCADAADEADAADGSAAAPSPTPTTPAA